MPAAESPNAARTTAWREVGAPAVGVEFAACYATLKYNCRDFRPTPSTTSTSEEVPGNNSNRVAATASAAVFRAADASSAAGATPPSVAAADPYDDPYYVGARASSPASASSSSAATTAATTASATTSSTAAKTLPLLEAAAAAVISCVPTGSTARAYSKLADEMEAAMAVLDRAEPMALHLARRAAELVNLHITCVFRVHREKREERL